MRDSKNMVIGMLCAVVCIMAVAYAAFSTSLTVTTTATVASNWCVRIKEVSCPADEKKPVAGGAADSVTAEVVAKSDLSAEISMSFRQPGDQATCTVTYENCGDLNATISHSVQKKIGAADWASEVVSDSGVAEFNTSNDGIEFYVSGLQTQPLGKNNQTVQVTIRGKYLDVASGQVSPAVKEAKIKISSQAKQAAN